MNIGTIIQWGSNTIPDNWLLCDGSAVSRTTYAELFSVIGTNFGTGDGSTTFNLPDLRGRVGVGKSSDTEFDTLGETGGSKYLQEHRHEGLYWNGSANGRMSLNQESGKGYQLGWNSGAGAGNTFTGYAGDGDAGNLQPYIVTNYIIKALTPDTIKISELESASSINNGDILPIVQSGETKKVTVSNLVKKQQDEIIELMNEIEDIDGDLLWTNDNPTNPFSNGTLQLDLTDYDIIEIWYRGGPSSSDGLTSIKTKKESGYISMLSFEYLSGEAGGDCILYRNVKATNNGLQFGIAYALGIAANSNSTVHNGCIVPYYIKGYKEIQRT